MSNFEKDINSALRNLLEIEELDEMNVTANMDGGEGPVKTPHAFKDSDGTDEDDEPDHDSIEVFDYKKPTESKNNFKESTYKEFMNQMHLNEAKYRDYKKDESASSKQKVNSAIKEINSKLFEVEKILRQNSRLKTEMGVDKGQYWQKTRGRLGKISERLLKINKYVRELSA
jgi:hypothetical protein